jgi:hypothetical protein
MGSVIMGIGALIRRAWDHLAAGRCRLAGRLRELKHGERW